MAGSARINLSTFTSRVVAILLLATATLSIGTFRAVAQEATDEVIRVNTNLVTIPVVVTNKAGQRVAGLRSEDFILRSNGESVELKYFASGAERVAIVYLLDSSGSARDFSTHQSETALALFSSFEKRSRMSVLHFKERTEIAARFTSDKRRLLKVFRPKALPGHKTAIFDAVATALQLIASEKADPIERRIIILISDGLDNASALRPSAVISEAQSLGVSIYVLHLPIYHPKDGRLVPRPASRGFRDLAEKTGGEYFKIADVSLALDPKAEYDLAPIIRAIEEDLKGQYLLGFYSDGQGLDRYYRLDVELVRKRGRTIKSLRRGNSTFRSSSIGKE